MRKGFTLVELLISISLIGLMATVILTALDSGRKNARLEETKPIEVHAQ